MSTATETFQTTARHVEQNRAWKGPREDVCLMIVGRLTFSPVARATKSPLGALKPFMLFVMDVNFPPFRR